MKKLIVLLLTFICSYSPLLASEKSTVLITGANRGLGLEFATQFQTKGYNVIGTARSPAKADKLIALGVTVLQLDVTDQESVSELAKSLEGKTIDLLINNAGYFGRGDVTLEKVDFDNFERTLAINTLGPLRVVKSLIKNLQQGNRKTVINISSRLGSITNSTGRWYAYRSSKSALNQITKILSKEYKNFIFTVMHPGWVQTDMGGPNATYTPKESVSKMINIIEKLSKSDSGKFYDLEGNVIPW